MEMGKNDFTPLKQKDAKQLKSMIHRQDNINSAKERWCNAKYQLHRLAMNKAFFFFLTYKLVCYKKQSFRLAQIEILNSKKNDENVKMC